MPRRQPKPEPITPEEVMDSPALRGLETLLQSRSPEELAHGPYDVSGKGAPSAGLSSGHAISPPGATPIGVRRPGVSPDGYIQPGDSPRSATSVGYSQSGEAPAGELPPYAIPMAALPEVANAAVFKPGPKIHRAARVRDGHSAGEHAIYLALWNAASPESPDTKLIRIGYGGLQSLTNLDKTNCKDNIQSLIRKLAVEIVSPFSVARNEGNTYRIFSERAILKRRQLAGMEWVIRNKGVRFVENPNVVL
jgi:hypothetical protein